MPPSKDGGSPWSYIPSLYFPAGMMGYLLVWQIMNLLKVTGYPNTVVSLVSGLGFVGAFRFLYAPWLDGIASKRGLLMVLTRISVLLFLLIAGIIALRLPTTSFLPALFGALIALALVASAYDTAVDGYYMRALDEKDQAKFIGIKTGAYRVGNLFVSTILAWGAAKLAASYGAIGVDSPDKTGFYIGNATLFLVAAILVFGMLQWNRRSVPVLEADRPVRPGTGALREMLKEYFGQKSIVLICALILFYRFGEGFLTGMMTTFALDASGAGGLGVPAASVPLMSAFTSMPMMIAGGILGGLIIVRYGLKRTFIPLALVMSLPNLASVFLAIYRPGDSFTIWGERVYTWFVLASALENFTYGLSFSALQYYVTVMAAESGRNKTSMLAVSSALQYFGFFLPMMLSGAIQSLIGYVGVFTLSVLGGLPVIFIIRRLPMPRSEVS